jgi:rhodanese-related sulfurtransferase
VTAPATTPSLDERGLPRGYPYRPELEATPRELKALLAKGPGAVVLIDCRTPSEHKAARIEGATLIPLDELAQRAEEIEDAAAEGTPLVIHCHHGGRSMKASLFLRQKGLPAKSLAGGIDLWSIDVDPSVPRY